MMSIRMIQRIKILICALFELHKVYIQLDP